MQTGRPTVYSTDAMISTPHYLATAVGHRVLQDGGNAVDAAIAANAVLHLVIPHQCHLGGDLFALIWDPGSETLQGLNASGPAPAGASIEQVQSAGHDKMPERGALSVTVPGTAAGWLALQKRYGSVDIGDLLEPAQRYARCGLPLTSKVASAVDTHRWLLEQDPAALATFNPGNAPRAGMIVRQPELADTLAHIASNGAAGFYTGPVAEDMVDRLRSGGSSMSLDDLAAYEPEWVEPLCVPYRGVELVELPANSQGPAALLLALIAAGLPESMLNSENLDLIDLEVRATDRVFEDRDRYISDPKFAGVDQDRFLSDDYARSLRDDLLASSSVVSTGVPAEDGDTAYLCAVDSAGLAVSLIQSVYMGFGSGVVAPKSGVLFQNRGYSFSLDANHVNALQGGKRPRHTLIPAMLMREGRPWVIFGAMGGDGQAQTHLQLLHQLVDLGRTPQQAIEAPRWLRQTTPDGEVTLRLEPTYGQQPIAELRRRGHEIVVGDAWDQRMGHAQMIMIDEERGVLAGGADPRGDGLALGI